MKKLSLILAGAFLLGGISFASPIVKKQTAPAATTAKQTAKPGSKAAKSTKTPKKATQKAPVATPASK